LIVHRLLKAFLHKDTMEASQAMGSAAADLAEAAQHCSMRERVATDAERELIRIKQVRYAENHLGEEHMGTVVGINAKGAYVELVDAFIEGFIPMERFGADFSFNEKLYQLRGRRSGKVIQIGDQIQAQIVRTNPHLQQIELEPLNGVKATRAKIEKMERGDERPRRAPVREERERRPSRPERTEKTARGGKPPRDDRGGRPDRSERPKKGERSSRPNRFERAQMTEKPARFEKNLERSEKTSRPNRLATDERPKKEEPETKKKDSGGPRDFWKPEDFE
jgi:ribonuclease R